MCRLDCSGGLGLGTGPEMVVGFDWALKLSFWDKIGGTILIGECRKHKRNFNGYG